jgi:hypothetical protein
MSQADQNISPVVVEADASGWRWSVIEGGRVAAEGPAPDRDTAHRYGAFAAAAVAGFGRIGRRY